MLLRVMLLREGREALGLVPGDVFTGGTTAAASAAGDNLHGGAADDEGTGASEADCDSAWVNGASWLN